MKNFFQLGCTLILPLVSNGKEVDFARDIQPILARNCYECHGPDLQKGKLRLDDRASALTTIVPGKPEESELNRRIHLPKGHEDVMPSRGEPLNKTELAKIEAWIRSGANWPDNVVAATHWSYIPPVRPELPEVKRLEEARNPIDHFIFARLENEGLKPSPEADRAILLRRVALDLTGLPPSPEQVKAFVEDKSPDAYEKVVDQLLASPQYGVRWARPWLDLARYADSSGYQRDNLWELWPYRDWVIQALNADMPFDQFTIEQIAGDLLPDASIQQKVATGFNRCVPTNVEAGADQEETRVNQIFDRVNTVGSIWLGSTLECAQCHNHKYDPFSQKEYYQLFAFFNNTPQETDFRTPNSTAALKLTGPVLTLPDAEADQKKAEIQAKIRSVDDQIEKTAKMFAATQTGWEQQLLSRSGKGAMSELLKVVEFHAESGSLYQVLEDQSVLLIENDNDANPIRDSYTVTVGTTLSNIVGFKLETLTDARLPGNGPGRAGEQNPNFVLNNFTVQIVSPGNATEGRPIKLRKPKASYAQRGFPPIGAIDENGRSGWGIAPEFGKEHWLFVETTAPVNVPEGARLVFKLEQNSGAGRTIGRLRLSAVTGEPEVNAVRLDILSILRKPAPDRSQAEVQTLADYRFATDEKLMRLRAERSRLEGELKRIRPPQTFVMQEMKEGRASALFVRGSFLEKGETVQAGTPAVLHALPGEPANRLTLARWLVSTNNPLAARVAVNRWWAEFFGQGLVTTPEDFGIKGELPTHPDLLDWLAIEFMSPTVAADAKVPAPWSMKHIHRLIVTSATYRQSSAISPELLERDDKNKLYARGPRFRMEAEMIRDNALAIAGLLSLKQGGPPIRPYQPPGIWESKVGGDNISYEVSKGEDRYRRGIYIVWKRTSPYPSFINFDATERTACVVKRSRSNTPLQALTLLNDPVYVEAAAALANRVLVEKPAATVRERIRHAFTVCLARSGQSGEIETLEKLFQEQLEASRKDPESARKLTSAFKPATGVDIAEFAAWHAVAWALLNLNETITKG